MRIVTSARREDRSDRFRQALHDPIEFVWKVSLFAVALVFGYLLYGLFSGQLTAASHSPADQAHTAQLVGNLTTGLTVGILLAVATSLFLFYEETILGPILTIIAAVLGFGLPYAVAVFGPNQGGGGAGDIDRQALDEIWIMAMMIGVPGLILILWQMVKGFHAKVYGQDLLNVSYGKGAIRESSASAMLGPFARCAQMPFCREGIRKSCALFHAKSNCWRIGVGCMCEPNLVITSVGGEYAQPDKASHTVGFVPIGDLIARSEAAQRPAAAPTIRGRNGVRIPINPHITPAQKRSRCHNCIIFKEHQRRKYQFLSVPATLFAPILVFWQYDSLRNLVSRALSSGAQGVGQLAFNTHGTFANELAKQMIASPMILTAMLVCLTLLLMTWVHQLLEFCVFKLQI